MLLHFLPKVSKASNQAVVQGLQLLGRLLPVDANPICQERDLEGRTGTLVKQNMFRFEASVNDNDGGRIYLQGDELFKDVNAFVILWVLLDVGLCEECLKRMKTGYKLGNFLRKEEVSTLWHRKEHNFVA